MRDAIAVRYPTGLPPFAALTRAVERKRIAEIAGSGEAVHIGTAAVGLSRGASPFISQENTMRYPIIAAALLITFVAGLWSGSILGGKTPQPAHAAAAPAGNDVMQMMRGAHDLPAQQFDAY